MAVESTSSASSSTSTSDFIIGQKYRLDHKIGSGSFGEVHLGIHLTSGEKVAVKLERCNASHPQLMNEKDIYTTLKGGTGIPHIRWFGQEREYNVLVMELLGPTLLDLFEECKYRFSLKTVLMLADQMIKIMEFVHSKHFVHRDIKPENFLMGVGANSNKVHLIDFGLAKKYWDSRRARHIAYREEQDLIGTARYSSLKTHLGVEQSRRDDMEVIGYVVLDFLRGNLPWKGSHQMILEAKMSTSVGDLCKGFPSEFEFYINYCRELGFDAVPDYAYLRLRFHHLFKSFNYEYDDIFDWTVLEQKSYAEAASSASQQLTTSQKDV